MAAETEHAENGGIPKGAGTISTENGLAALCELLEAGDTQAAVMPIDWPEFVRAYPAFVADPFLREIIEVAAPAEQRSVATIRSALVAAPADTQQTLAQDYLREESARVLGMASEQIDFASPLSFYGFDSLMALQLKNRIEADLSAVVPMIKFLNGPSIEQLAATVLDAVQATSAVTAANESHAELWEEGIL